MLFFPRYISLLISVLQMNLQLLCLKMRCRQGAFFQQFPLKKKKEKKIIPLLARLNHKRAQKRIVSHFDAFLLLSSVAFAVFPRVHRALITFTQRLSVQTRPSKIKKKKKENSRSAYLHKHRAPRRLPSAADDRNWRYFDGKCKGLTDSHCEGKKWEITRRTGRKTGKLVSQDKRGGRIWW